MLGLSFVWCNEGARESAGTSRVRAGGAEAGGVRAGWLPRRVTGRLGDRAGKEYLGSAQLGRRLVSRVSGSVGYQRLAFAPLQTQEEPNR